MLVFKAHRLLYHSAVGSREIKKNLVASREQGEIALGIVLEEEADRVSALRRGDHAPVDRPARHGPHLLKERLVSNLMERYGPHLEFGSWGSLLGLGCSTKKRIASLRSDAVTIPPFTVPHVTDPTWG